MCASGGPCCSRVAALAAGRSSHAAGSASAHLPWRLYTIRITPLTGAYGAHVRRVHRCCGAPHSPLPACTTHARGPVRRRNKPARRHRTCSQPASGTHQHRARTPRMHTTRMDTPRPMNANERPSNALARPQRATATHHSTPYARSTRRARRQQSSAATATRPWWQRPRAAAQHTQLMPGMPPMPPMPPGAKPLSYALVSSSSKTLFDTKSKPAKCFWSSSFRGHVERIAIDAFM